MIDFNKNNVISIKTRKSIDDDLKKEPVEAAKQVEDQKEKSLPVDDKAKEITKELLELIEKGECSGVLVISKYRTGGYYVKNIISEVEEGESELSNLLELSGLISVIHDVANVAAIQHLQE
jgi:hypothetical protein